MTGVKVSVLNPAGIHARPAGMIAKEAAKFKSNIEIEFNSRKVNAKSIMSVMSLGVSKGDDVIIHVNGEDQELAQSSLISLFNKGFGEL